MADRFLVVKVGGSLLKSGFPPTLLKDLKSAALNHRLTLVHGGAALVTETAQKMGKEQKFIVSPDGMKSRYTDRETMEVYTMVMAGKINKQVVAFLQSGGVNAIGLSGADGQLLRASRKKKLIILDERGRKVAIEGGYTGKIEEVNPQPLRCLMDLGYMPVVAPIAVDDEFQLLNVDSDRAAAYIAKALKADCLILCTDVEGLILNGALVKRLKLEEARENLPKIGHGMRKKIYAAVEALEGGVREVVVTKGALETPLTSALNHEAGTLIVPQ
ncbi:[LysW]-aminoadipate/[LysW]-glutamate kinase [Candidatus Hecatella orcuttiae]|uniref:[LysW]-aminoadipate/[LysW]-glutamate kinase n=1 Tax=Candidatus Hecatella orcuttiae TaxID=1935119 RepID=UPI002867F1CD|nr:[LysW]-aminoadipate/[LysW]-glutamate kinase [Candidatus Hecatella orcuttiae]